jgi:hypothetical protein
MPLTPDFTWSVKTTSVPDLHFPRSAFKALMCLVLLAGCQTTAEKAASVPNGGETAAAGATAPGTVSGVGEASKPAGAAPTAQIVRFSPDEFLGYSPERVLPVLGAPDFVRRDGTAQIWQYRATNCILDLFLYKTGNETRVRHAELRPRVPGAEPVDACYSRMRQERKTTPAG